MSCMTGHIVSAVVFKKSSSWCSFTALLTPRMGAGLGFKHAVKLQCEKDVGMGHCLYVDLCFHAIIPTLFVYFLACHPYIF